jgi:hypothetical protein
MGCFDVSCGISSITIKDGDPALLFLMVPYTEYSQNTEYYPICNYSIIWIIGNQKERDKYGIKEVHPSYINACIEICEEIILNKEAEDKGRKGNVAFAKKFLKNHKLQIA